MDKWEVVKELFTLHMFACLRLITKRKSKYQNKCMNCKKLINTGDKVYYNQLVMPARKITRGISMYMCINCYNDFMKDNYIKKMMEL